MHRTAQRPLSSGKAAVSPRGALVFGTVLGVVSVSLLWTETTAAAAALTLAAILLYVVGYTMLLKRRTPSNIVWGGSAGCMPTLIGWAAVTGRLALTPFVLFAIVFFWTPPHFWALAMRFRSDYAAAGVPMLPVVASPATVVSRMLRYSWLTVAASLALWPVARTGPVYPWALWHSGRCSCARSRPWPPGRRGRTDLPHARLPLVDHLPEPALPRDRGGGRPGAALVTAAAAHPARRPLRVAAVVVACALLTAASGRAGARVGAVVGSMVDEGVTVTFRWTQDGKTGTTLVTTFAPTEVGYHLYAAGLPATGVQGIGRPTRVELGGALVPDGQAWVDRTAVAARVAGVDEPVPTYPAGPVTMRTPVRLDPGRHDYLVWVTYAACSAQQCLPPVEHRRVVLSIPVR